MAHKLVTDELLGKAVDAALAVREDRLRGHSGTKDEWLKFAKAQIEKEMCAALEAVADDLIEAVAASVRDAFREEAYDVVEHIRSLKSQGQ